LPLSAEDGFESTMVPRTLCRTAFPLQMSIFISGQMSILKL